VAETAAALAKEGEEGMTEQWRPVPGYEGRYEVSDAGRIRSLPRPKTIAGRTHQMRGRVLKAFCDTTTRYLCVNLCDGAAARKCAVHVLVLEAFVGPRPEGMFGLHGDDNRQNPALSNLRWGTPADNAADMVANGNSCRGERSPKAVLTEEMARWIKESPQSSLALAPLLGVASSTIRAVRIGQNWSHV
jgi:hypothetical protein